MTNSEAIERLQRCKRNFELGKVIGAVSEEGADERIEAYDLAIKALNHEVYWEDVKQALNGWLNNTTSPDTALNDIYRAYMGRGQE